MRSLSLVCAALLTACLLACGSGNVEGKYYSVDNDQEYIELKKNGEFYLKAGELDFSGQYTVNGKTIMLNPVNGISAKGKIEKNMIIDNDGAKWKKK